MERLRAAAHLVAGTARVSGALWTASLVADRVLPVGVLGLWPLRRVAPEVLGVQVESMLRAWGMAEEHAATTARYVLYADLHGIDSHGCAMMAYYHRGVCAGSIDPVAAAVVERETETTALVDGGHGLGHVPADLAMRTAIAKCRQSGVGCVAVRRSGHFGAAGAYAALAAGQGLLGFATTTTREPALVPTRGRDAMLGTNPIAVAAPAGRNAPFLLDMATSTAPLGRIAVAGHRGRRIPEGWALDRYGEPRTRARRALAERRLTPLGGSEEMGGHKGYGLAAAVEILAALLPGARSAVGCGPADGGIGHLFVALDPERFRAPGEFERDVDALVDALHASPTIDPLRPVLVAGDPEASAATARARDGIPLTRAVVEDLRAVAHASGVPFLLERAA
jgi:LDH2 family malate/lactate/ureidoglycolate dehydrogenase